MTVNLATLSATGTNGVKDFQKVIGGSGDDVLTADNLGDTLIGGAGSNVLYQGLGADTLEGSGTDRFVMNPASTNSATIIESGVGTLDYSLFTTALAVNLAGDSAPNVSAGSSFSNLIGVIGGTGTNNITGSKNDTFGLPDNWGSSTTIAEDAQSTNDTLDFSAATGPLSVILGASGSANPNNAISVTEQQSGTTTGILNLASGNLVGTINGGLGDDTYTFYNNWGNVTVNESSLPKTDTLDFSNVTQNLTFNISATGSVTVTSAGGSTLTVSGSIGNIIGGKGTNTFKFADQGTLDGYITGLATATANILDYSSYTTAVSVSLGDMDLSSTVTVNSTPTTNVGVGSATGVAGINGITEVIAGSTSLANTLTGYDVEDGASSVNTTNTWNITGANAGTLAVSYANTDSSNSYYGSNGFTHSVSFQNFEYLSGTANSDSNFTVEAGGSVSGSISGRPYGPWTGTNTLTIASGVSEIAANTIFSGTDTGTIKLDAKTINYSGIDSMTDNSTATTRSYSYDTNDTALLTFAGSTVLGDTWTVNVDGSSYTATVGTNQTPADVLTQLAASIQQGGLEANVRGDMILVTGAATPSTIAFTAPTDKSVVCEIDLPSTTSPQSAQFSLTNDSSITGNLLLTSLNESFPTISFASPGSLTRREARATIPSRWMRAR